ncbi:MAG: PilZ domain-containing protein [Acidobacteria bacterium]|nr:PilZ domain-containing protein [Acidobacteriota bacterium]
MRQQSHGEIDQRRFHRYGVNFPCTVRPVRKRKRKGSKSPVEISPAIEAETKDMSTGGLYFEASADWKVGTEIECLLHLPVKAFGGRPVAIRCRGKITRVTQKTPGSIGVGATIEQFEFQHLEKNDASGISPFA